MKWTIVEVIEKARLFRDHVSDGGRFRVAEGFDELEKRAGRPYTLFDGGRYVGTFSSAREARADAERRAAGLPKIRRRRAS